MNDRDLMTAIVLACIASGGPVDPEHLINYSTKVLVALKIELEKL